MGHYSDLKQSCKLTHVSFGLLYARYYLSLNPKILCKLILEVNSWILNRAIFPPGSWKKNSFLVPNLPWPSISFLLFHVVYCLPHPLSPALLSLSLTKHSSSLNRSWIQSVGNYMLLRIQTHSFSPLKFIQLLLILLIS